jgi:glycosyltransferase involved in cell wall biosynthesis
MPLIVLVTPVWNDAERLGHYGAGLARALAESGLSVKWVVSDDGSSPEEQAKLRVMVAGYCEIFPAVELVLSGQRSRKGAAIYRAWNQNEGADWLAFVDGDGAIDADSMVRLLREAIAGDSNACTIGIRDHRSDAPVRRRMIRALALRVFSFFVRRIVGLKCRDTQCGAKVVPGRAYREVRRKLKEPGYVFDVELLLALSVNGCEIKTVPIAWKEVAGGKVELLRDGWMMTQGLLRIRRRIKSEAY